MIFLIMNSSHKILCDSSIMIEKALIYSMNALNKLSELWHTSVNHKARPVVEEEHDKSWNDHDFGLLWPTLTTLEIFVHFRPLSLTYGPLWLILAHFGHFLIPNDQQ